VSQIARNGLTFLVMLGAGIGPFPSSSAWGAEPAEVGWRLIDDSAQPISLGIGTLPAGGRSMIADREGAAVVEEWRIRLEHPLADVKLGKAKVRFRGRASSAVPTRLVLSQNRPPFNGLGLYQDVALTPEWKVYEFEFSILADEATARLHLNLGAVAAKVEVADFALTLQGAEKPLESPLPSVVEGPIEKPASVEMTYPWKLGMQAGGLATMQVLDGPARVRVAVENPGSETWAVNLIFPVEPFEKGVAYKVIARLRAEKSRVITLAASKDGPPWSSVGLYRQLELTTEWKDFDLEFVASSTQEPSRIYLDLGGHQGNVELASLILDAAGKQTTLFPVAGTPAVAGPPQPAASEPEPVVASQDSVTSPPVVGQAVPNGWEFSSNGPAARCQIVAGQPWSVEVRVGQPGARESVVLKRAYQLHGAAPTMVVNASVPGPVAYQVVRGKDVRSGEFSIPSPGDHRLAFDLKDLPAAGEIEFRFLLGDREAVYTIGE
jgi:hypothetical protein